MSVQVKHRRDTATNIAAFSPAQGEIVVDTTNSRMIVGDGTTLGGIAAAKLSEVATVARRALADTNAIVTAADRIVAFISLTAARTITLPAANAYPATALLRIVDESGSCSSVNTLTLNRSGADTINGAASFVLNGAYMSAALQSDGVSKWTLLNSETVDAFSYVGIGTAPDPVNVVSAYGASALLNGANFSLTVNKSAMGNTASVLFQNAFSARAQIGLLGDDNFSFKVSANGLIYNTSLILDRNTGAVTLGNARTAVADANYAALATDREVAFTSITANRVVTLPAASAFPSGHALIVIDESGAVSLANAITITRAGSDTISGLNSAKIVTPYGYCRLISNGSNGWVVAGRSTNIQTFAATGTYLPTPGATKCEIYLIGGGGGGGGGALQTATNPCSGGGGGGGGGVSRGVLFANQIGASATVTIGAGGSAGSPAASGPNAGGNGGNGGSTQFGPFFKALGGAGGVGGQLGTGSGGGGGGGLTDSASAGAGATGGSAAGGGTAGGSGSASAAANTPGGGSGGGGGVNGAGGASSGASLFGASGGGGGGGISAGNVASAGGAGGYASAGGASSAYQNASGGAPGAAGANGSAPTISLGFAGNGGGGGGSATSGSAGSGGQGFGGGGGAGGGSAQISGAAGAGGAGGAGYAIVVEYF